MKVATLESNTEKQLSCTRLSQQNCLSEIRKTKTNLKYFYSFIIVPMAEFLTPPVRLGPASCPAEDSQK